MLYFGTDGIRAHQASLFFSPQSLSLVGQALALWGKQRPTQKKEILCIYDTRASAPNIKRALAHGLKLEDFVLFDGGIIPTPAAHWIMQKRPFDFALILTASHNPAHDNGIKILLPNAKITSEDEASIEHHFSNLLLRSCLAETEQINQTQLQDFQAEARQRYLAAFNEQTPLPSLHKKKIILDCAHGAMSEVAEALFAPTQASIVCINNTPNGENINMNCGAVHPESLIAKVVEENADIGFSFDGDGDRVVAVNTKGQVKTGDDLLFVLSQHPKFASIKYLVGTPMNNQGLEVQLKKEGKELVRSEIGDRAVMSAMKKYNTPLGGEPGGHIIIETGIPSSDGAAAARWVLDSCASRQDYSLNSFTPFVQVNASLRAFHKPDFSTLPTYQQTLKEIQCYLPLGRTLVRYSGTEPILRIMVENTEAAPANQALQQLTTLFQTILS